MKEILSGKNTSVLSDKIAFIVSLGLYNLYNIHLESEFLCYQLSFNQKHWIFVLEKLDFNSKFQTAQLVVQCIGCELKQSSPSCKGKDLLQTNYLHSFGPVIWCWRQTRTFSFAILWAQTGIMIIMTIFIECLL